MTNEEEQKAFEAWVKLRRKYHGDDLTKSKIGYCDREAHYMWQSWQARAELDGWKPIEKLPKRLPRNKIVLYHYKESHNGRMLLGSVITTATSCGYREKTHFMFLDYPHPPKQQGE